MGLVLQGSGGKATLASHLLLFYLLVFCWTVGGLRRMKDTIKLNVRLSLFSCSDVSTVCFVFSFKTSKMNPPFLHVNLTSANIIIPLSLWHIHTALCPVGRCLDVFVLQDILQDKVITCCTLNPLICLMRLFRLMSCSSRDPERISTMNRAYTANVHI